MIGFVLYMVPLIYSCHVVSVLMMLRFQDLHRVCRVPCTVSEYSNRDFCVPLCAYEILTGSPDLPSGPAGPRSPGPPGPPTGPCSPGEPRSP